MKARSRQSLAVLSATLLGLIGLSASAHGAMTAAVIDEAAGSQADLSGSSTGAKTFVSPAGASDLWSVPKHVLQHDRKERRLVGLLNRARERAGMQPLEISKTAAAVGHLFLRDDPQVPSLRTKLGITESEWLYIAQAIAGLYPIGPQTAFEHLRDRVLNKHAKNKEMIGVSRHGLQWDVTLISRCEPSIPDCVASGDYGIPPGGGKQPGRKAKSLSLQRAQQKGRKLRLIYRVTRKAPRRAARFEVSRGKRQQVYRPARRGTRIMLRLRASRNSWMRVRATLPSSQGVAGIELCHRVKPRRGKSSSWSAAKIRRCR